MHYSYRSNTLSSSNTFKICVHGMWWFWPDWPISLPIRLQAQIPATDDDNDDWGNNNNINDNSDGTNQGSNDDNKYWLSNHKWCQFLSINTTTQQQPQTFTLSDPFANPAELQVMKCSFAQQPNWKVAVVEGKTWEGSAEDSGMHLWGHYEWLRPGCVMLLLPPDHCCHMDSSYSKSRVTLKQ